MSLTLRVRLVLGAAAFVLALPTTQAAAQPVPVAQHTEAVAAPPPVLDQLTVNMAAGATLNAGNTEAYAGNAGGRLGLIRHPHALTVEALGTLGYTKANPEADVEQTSANVIGRARYDLFLSRDDALFVAIAPRRDTFAGLNLRLQNQVGYLRNLYFPADAHRLWTELGYDLTYDVFARVTKTTTRDVTAEVNRRLPNGDDVDRYAGTLTETITSSDKPDPEVIHSARVFFGYTNLIHPAANLNLGVETLFDFQDAKNVRVNGLAEITTSVTGAFKLGIQSRLFYDNVPVPKKDEVDALIAVQLIYTFDSLAGQAAAPCDCSAAVAEAHAECARNAAEPAPVLLEPAPTAPAPSVPTEAAPAAPAAEPAPAAPAPALAPAAPASP